VKQPEELSEEFEQDKFERELTRAMRSVDPPHGFANLVMARAQAEVPVRARLLWMPRRVQQWTGGVIAAGLLVGVFFGEEAHLRHQREQAAQQQFETAMRITDRTLEHVQQQLSDAGVRFDH